MGVEEYVRSHQVDDSISDDDADRDNDIFIEHVSLTECYRSLIVCWIQILN